MVLGRELCEFGARTRRLGLKKLSRKLKDLLLRLRESLGPPRSLVGTREILGHGSPVSGSRAHAHSRVWNYLEMAPTVLSY